MLRAHPGFEVQGGVAHACSSSAGLQHRRYARHIPTHPDTLDAPAEARRAARFAACPGPSRSLVSAGVVARSQARQGARRARLPGDPIVLVRTESGAVFALEDRCAHRQVPLHGGVVEGESIRCCYHGWTYDCTGRCIDVPYLGRERLPNGVRSYPCREEEGLIFVFPGNPALADRTALADARRRPQTKRTRRAASAVK